MSRNHKCRFHTSYIFRSFRIQKIAPVDVFLTNRNNYKKNIIKNKPKKNFGPFLNPVFIIDQL